MTDRDAQARRAKLSELNAKEIQQAIFKLVRVAARCEVMLADTPDDGHRLAQREMAEQAVVALGVVRDKIEKCAAFERAHLEAIDANAGVDLSE